MRDWDQKERPKRPKSDDPVEMDAPEAEGGIWERYGPAVLAVILVTVTAGICNSIVNLSPR
jgi:hypothetical protein